MKINLVKTAILFGLLLSIACKEETKKEQSTDISDISTKEFREFKVLDSKHINNAGIWSEINEDLKDFTEENYNTLKPLILDKDIPSLHKNIQKGKLSYELLTKFYLYRIRKFDRENDLSLNSVIAINPNAIKEAKAKDEKLKNMDITKDFNYTVFGMPILLKDNINASGMPTTAGAVVLKDNFTEDAFIVKQLKANNAIILGKANLSEWAYFFCGDCPSGYSAIGGQTLNPYGRKIIDTGGSSSGSGVAVAANFCVGAVGSETSGSILSPSSQNSVVGLKPQPGLLSRSGIVPISSTLDTPGPMTKNVIDNAILLGAMDGYDRKDFKSKPHKWPGSYYSSGLINNLYLSLKGKTFGAFKGLLNDSLYVNAINVLKTQGAKIIELDAEDIELPNFIRLLNLDMKKDLPEYFAKFASSSLTVKSIEDVIAFNTKDSVNIMPYGQRLFQGVSDDSATKKEFSKIKEVLKTNGKEFFDVPMGTQNLDGILSINNYHAGFAAVAEYPALTVPMGYTKEGVPRGLTFIGKFEKSLIEFAYSYEQASKKRKAPSNYK